MLNTTFTPASTLSCTFSSLMGVPGYLWVWDLMSFSEQRPRKAVFEKDVYRCLPWVFLKHIT